MMRRWSYLWALPATAFLALAGAAEQGQALDLDEPATLTREAQSVSFAKADGGEVTLSDYRGRVVVVNFWATWCAPCKREMPSIGRLQAAFDERELVVLAIAVDRASPDKLERFMADVEVNNLLVLRDPAMASMRAFALRGLPATIVLDAYGHQVARHDGFDEWDRAETIEALQGLLPGA